MPRLHLPILSAPKAPRYALLWLLLPAGCGIPGLPELPNAGEPVAEAAEAAPHQETTGGMTGRDCFQRHLREAIHLNERRAPIYADWSDGEAEPVSRRLIRSERRAILAARLVDRRARRFQEAGIPVGCVEFISMSMTPVLPRAPLTPPAEPYAPGPDPDSLASALVEAYGTGGFASLHDTAGRVLEAIEERPYYHCMVRHLVESLQRVAAVAPSHAAAARAEGLPSTVPLSELLVRLHLAGLPEAARLDRDAAPLQQTGIPILCRDVPPISHSP